MESAAIFLWSRFIPATWTNSSVVNVGRGAYRAQKGRVEEACKRDNVIASGAAVVGEPRDTHDPLGVSLLPRVLLLIRGSYHNYIHIYTVCTALGLLRLSRVARWRVGHWRRASRIHRYKDLRSHGPGGYSFLHRRPSAAGQWVVQRGRELLSRVMGSTPW